MVSAEEHVPVALAESVVPVDPEVLAASVARVVLADQAVRAVSVAQVVLAKRVARAVSAVRVALANQVARAASAVQEVLANQVESAVRAVPADQVAEAVFLVLARSRRVAPVAAASAVAVCRQDPVRVVAPLAEALTAEAQRAPAVPVAVAA